MEQQTKTPLQIMADALAEMTERAMEAERQRDAAKEDASNWYDRYVYTNAKLKETEAALQYEEAEHKKTRAALTHALTPTVKVEG